MFSTPPTGGMLYEIPDPHRVPEWLRSVTLGEVKPEPDPHPAPRPSTQDEIRQCDALAVSLSAATRKLTVPLARAAAAFRKKEGWCEFGYARVRDYARERTGFSGTWLTGLASVGDRIEDTHGFLEALTGDDGGAPLKRSAAISVAGVLTAESLAAWLELARRLNPKDLRAAVRRAKAAGSRSPVEAPSTAEAGIEDADGEPEDSHPDDERYVRMMVPAAVVSAFEEVLDLYRAVEGSESTIAAFVEALVGDA